MKLLFVCLLACLSFANGVLYEDQIDNYAWQIKRIGHIRKIDLINQQSIKQSNNQPRLIVSSSHGVTASLSLDHTSKQSTNDATEGVMDWRYATPSLESNLIDQTISQSSNQIYTLEHLTGVVRSHSVTGSLKWESDRLGNLSNDQPLDLWKFSSGDQTSHQSISQGILLTDYGVLEWVDHSLRLLSIQDGSSIWTQTLEQSINQVAVSETSVVVLTSEPSVNQLIKFKLVGFALSDASSINMPGPIDQSNDQTIKLSQDASFLAFYDRSGDKIVMIDLSTRDQFGKTAMPVGSLMGSSSTKDPVHSIDQFVGWSTGLIIRTKGFQHIFSIKQSNNESNKKSMHLHLVRSLPALSQLSTNALSVNGKQRWGVFRLQSINPSVNHLIMSVYEIDAMEPVQSVTQSVRRGESIENAWLFNDQSKMIIAVVTTDHRLFVAVDESVALIREEAVSSISQMIAVPLPPSSALNDQSVTQALTHLTWYSRVQAQIIALQQTINQTIKQLITLQWASLLMSSNRPNKQSLDVSNNQLISSDEFGFRQMLLGSTDHLIVGIESEFGTIRYVVRVVDPSINPMIKQSIWKVFHVSPRCVTVLVRSVDLTNKKLTQYRHVDVDPLDGTILNQSIDQSINQPIDVAIKLPLIDDTTEKHILLLAHRDHVWFHPSLDQSNKQAIEQSIQHLHYYHIDASSNIVEGYSFQSNKQSIKQSNVQSMLVYSYHFPSNEHIVAVSSHQSNNQSISSSTKMLGDMSGVLYKYLDQNLIAIATQRSSNQSTNLISSLSRSSDPSLCVYLFDSSSGQLIEKFVHRSATGPVSLVVTENEVLYSYTNSQFGSPLLSAVEVFEAKSGVGLSLVSAMARSKQQMPAFDVFSEATPTLLTASWMTRKQSIDMKCTHSARGITARECVVLDVHGSLTGWPSMMLNTRRTMQEPSITERQEGLIPYAPELPMSAQYKLSANATLVKARHIITTSTRLESTSIVCAYGVDVWCTRVTPSTAFDRLNEDFNYALLGLTVVAVMGAIVATNKMAKQKELSAAWK